MAVKHQKEIDNLLDKKSMLYNSVLSKMLGSINDSIFLSQLLYWHGQGKDPDWTFKTVKECQKETGLSKSKQLTSQNRLIPSGILEVELRRSPPVRHFKVNIEKLHQLCREFRVKQRKSANQLAGKATIE